MNDILVYVLTGFVAQMIDGALGMAYGITAMSLLLSTGITPALASATVHMAECFTTGASALSHHAFGNVNRQLFKLLMLPGICGAVAGAWLVSSVSTELIAPIVSVYLLGMGVLIVAKALRQIPARTVTRHVAPLGLAGGFLDAMGGGGWGPIVASSLIARGNHAAQAIGSTSAVEFFVTFAASLTFFVTSPALDWRIVAGLAVGGVLGAPLGAWVCRYLPVKSLMLIVGMLIVGLSSYRLLN